MYCFFKYILKQQFVTFHFQHTKSNKQIRERDSWNTTWLGLDLKTDFAFFSDCQQTGSLCFAVIGQSLCCFVMFRSTILCWYVILGRSTVLNRFVGLELQGKLLMEKAFVLKHGPERAALSLCPQPSETYHPITWTTSCLPQRFTLTNTRTHPLTAPQPPTHTHTPSPAEVVISTVINCEIPLRLIESVGVCVCVGGGGDSLSICVRHKAYLKVITLITRH